MVCIMLVLLASLMLLPAHSATMLQHAAVTFELAGSGAPVHTADVSLPYHWSRLHGSAGGRAHFVLEFPASDLQARQAIYLPRIGNTFEVLLNGVIIENKGFPDKRHEDFSKQPHLLLIPSHLLHSRNTVDILIDVQPNRNGGLSTVMVGPEAEISAMYETGYFWRVTCSFIVTVVSCSLGAFALLLWLRQRETLYLFYAASELLWALYVSDVLISRVPVSWVWWDSIAFSAEGLAAVLVMKFSLMVVDQHKGPIKRATDWNLLLVVPAVLAGVVGGLPWVEPLLKCATDTVSLCAVVIIVRHGIRSPALERKVLAIAVLVMSAVATRDEAVLVILPYTNLVPAYANHYADIAWSRNAWVVFGITLAWIIAERLRASTREIAGMNHTLSRRLAEREAELSTVFAQRAHSERQQAMQEERQRLTRDMHDGLGSQLLGALHLAQNPAVPRDALADQLRETLDHLKLTVDAMQDTEGDIASLLGALRYRLGPRLEAAGVQLSWSVEALPAIAGWTLQQSRDLQMILFEAFSNLIRHAGANCATLHAAHEADRDHVLISLEDNGHGFDVDAASKHGGHGIANMQLRAARLNTPLCIESTSSGTRMTLCVPLDDAAGLSQSVAA